MIGLALAIALQASAPAAAVPQPQRWSILEPVANQPCTRKRDDGDIVVCADPLPSQALPYPDEVVPDGPVPSNRFMSGSGALAAQDTPCPISRSCIVGFGPPIVPMIKGAVDVAKRAFAKKPDRTGRVAIDLDTPQKGAILP